MTYTLYPSILLSLLLGSQRDFREDSRRLVERMQPKPELRGMENIPQYGPFLVTMNHYSRPGFLIVWAVMAISSALPHNSIWLMTNAWTKRSGTPGDWLQTRLSKVILTRIAKVYGMVSTPAMPPVAEETAERALSLRKLMKMLHEQPGAIVGLAPEGMDFPGGQLGKPAEGTGKMIWHTCQWLKQLVAVGVFEKNGQLVIQFGKPYRLSVTRYANDLDEKVIRQVMGRIAAQLPREMPGL